MPLPSRKIRTRENRASYRRFCRILHARHGASEGYGVFCTMWGDISGSKWRFSDLSLVAAVDITRPSGNRDTPGNVVVTLYHPRRYDP